MAEKDVELFVEDGICCEDGDDCVESNGSDSGSEAEHCGERLSSNQWPQSYSIDSSTTSAFPSFGWLRGTSSRYSSLDLGSQSGHDLNLKQPLLSGSIIEKDGLDKNFKKMISLTGDKAISCHVQIHGKLASHGCSFTQTVFNALVMSLIGSLFSIVVAIIAPTLCFLKLSKNKATKFQVAVSIVIVAIGIISAILGTYSSILKIVKSY